jgi:hypothetical protein
MISSLLACLLAPNCVRKVRGQSVGKTALEEVGEARLLSRSCASAAAGGRAGLHAAPPVAMSAPDEGQDVSVQNVCMDGQYAMRESGVNLELGILENLEWRYARLRTFRI